MQLRLDADVAVAAEPAVEPEGGPERQPATRRRAVGADDEGQGTEEPGGNAGERAALEDALPRPAQAGGLERAQPAVYGLLVVEGCAAAEIASVDERSAESTARGLVRDRQAVDATADDQQVVARCREARQIA